MYICVCVCVCVCMDILALQITQKILKNET